MFIDERIEDGKDGAKIKGRLKDQYGRATFEGSISSRRVIFWWQYEPKHSDSGVSRRPRLFDGELSTAGYHGRKFYFGTWIDRDKSFAPGTERGYGTFVLEEYTPSKTLEFLMRMDHK